MTSSPSKRESKGVTSKRGKTTTNTRSNASAATAAKKKEKLDRIRAELLEKERCKREIAEGKARALGVFLPKHVKALFNHFEKMVTFVKDESLLPQTDGLAVTSKWCYDVGKVEESVQGLNPTKLHKETLQLGFQEYLESLLEIITKGSTMDKFLLLFEITDERSKGGLTQLELFDLLKHNSTHPGGEEALYTWVKKHFREADMDRNGILSCKECVTILRRHKEVFDSLIVDAEYLLKKLVAPRQALNVMKNEIHALSRASS